MLRLLDLTPYRSAEQAALAALNRRNPVLGAAARHYAEHSVMEPQTMSDFNPGAVDMADEPEVDDELLGGV